MASPHGDAIAGHSVAICAATRPGDGPARPSRDRMRAKAASIVLAGFCLGASGALAVAETQPAPSLLDMIELWLVSNFDLEPAKMPPQLQSLPAARLVELRYGPDSPVRPGDVFAAYDQDSRTIYLTSGWVGRDPAELSVLVHEMVHHLQASAGTRFACPAEREKLAYQAQEAWLHLVGTDLQTALHVDPAALLVASICTN